MTRTRPRDVAVAVPPGWYGIDLDPAGTERSVRHLVDQQFRGRDDLPHVKSAVRDELLVSVQRARAGGGLHLWLSVDPVGPLPLPASLLVCALPPTADDLPEGATADEVLEASLRLRRDVGDDAELVDLPLGRSLRTQRRRAVTDAFLSEDEPDGIDVEPILVTGEPGDAADVPVVLAAVVEYLTPVPGSDGWVLLSFSTPTQEPELQEAFVDLFDAVAGTARWVR